MFTVYPARCAPFGPLSQAHFWLARRGRSVLLGGRAARVVATLLLHGQLRSRPIDLRYGSQMLDLMLRPKLFPLRSRIFREDGENGLKFSALFADPNDGILHLHRLIVALKKPLVRGFLHWARRQLEFRCHFDPIVH